MKLFNKFILTTVHEQSEKESDDFEKGYNYGKASSARKIETLERAATRDEKELDKLNDKLEILNKERVDARETMALQLENEDLMEALKSKAEGLDRLEKRLQKRENKLGDEEAGEYKRGYADGVADGVRKINQVTEKDRENAMKVAMVAAASHSTPEMVKEVSGGVKSLTEGA